MNRRSMLKSLIGAAIGSCVRCLPMPEKPKYPLIEAKRAPGSIEPWLLYDDIASDDSIIDWDRLRPVIIDGRFVMFVPFKEQP